MERISTVDLLVLASLDKWLYEFWYYLPLFTKHATLMRGSTVQSFTLQLVVPGQYVIFNMCLCICALSMCFYVCGLKRKTGKKPFFFFFQIFVFGLKLQKAINLTLWIYWTRQGWYSTNILLFSLSWWQWQDSYPWSQDYESSILPLSYLTSLQAGIEKLKHY